MFIGIIVFIGIVEILHHETLHSVFNIGVYLAVAIILEVRGSK